jgi:CarboxypepD_reg-like domain/TonB dependent receptor/TonB-dependent Receptor Plug Domain
MAHSFYKQSFLILFLGLNFSVFSQNYTLSGYVKDSANNEYLIGATLQIQGTSQGISTNGYGFYALNLPKGKHTLIIRYVGYNTLYREVNVVATAQIDFSLRDVSSTLNEVVVTNRKANEQVTKVEMSLEKMSAKTIKQIPTVLGEADVLKSIQLLPGVTAPNEGSSGFNVRGGAADQNLILLDEAIVYNPSHLLGFFSVFNADAIKDVTLYKGGIPAQYGGRLSSVLDVRMNEGSNKKWGLSGGIGLLSSRLTLETPIGKVKDNGADGSFLLSARRSYADVFLPLSSDTAINRNKLFFYDVNFRSNYKLGKNDRLFLSGYFGRDKIDIPNGFGNIWGNATTTLRWNHVFGSKIFMNLSAIYSNYDYKIKFYPGSSFEWTSALSNLNFKGDFNYFLNNSNSIKAGLGSILYNFEAGNITPLGTNSFINATDYPAQRAVENYVYAQNEQKVSPKLTISYGFRLSQFATLAGDSVKVYRDNLPLRFNTVTSSYEKGITEGYQKQSKNAWQNIQYGFEPRLNLNYTLTENSSVKASFNRMKQYIHLLSSSTSPTPLDIYSPSSAYIKPQIADQIAVGYFKNFNENAYELSIETYYKWMQNQFDFIDGASPVLNNSAETILLNGEAKAYGLELMLKKSQGRFTGWVSYTLSKSERKTFGTDGGTGINQGNIYPTNYDKPHNIALTGNYDLSKRWRISANFIFQSGRPVTYPVSKYTFNGLTIPEYSQRNAYRLPTYHRLDFAATRMGKQTKKRKSQWVFGVYNVYNRQNAASINFREDLVGGVETGLGTGITKAYKLTYFGVVPSISYEFKF